MKLYTLLVIAVFTLSGCAETIFAGAGLAGAATMEERSVGDNIDDQSINAEITHMFIQSNVKHLLTDVSVRVHEGRVLLTGRTSKPEIALEAVRLAWLAAGVREVINEIQVGKAGTNLLNYTKDNFIETQIEARLLATKHIRSLNYTVEVINGVAYLLGVAQNEQERRDAAMVASVTKGVNRVISYVRLKDAPERLEKTGKLREEGINRNQIKGAR